MAWTALSRTESEIIKEVVGRFLQGNESSARKVLSRTHRYTQFYRLTDSGILKNTALGVPTTDEMYLPRALAFHYCNEHIEDRARKCVSVVFQTLQSLHDTQADKAQFMFDDLEAEAGKIFAPPPMAEALKLGLYLANDMGILSLSSPPYSIQPDSFQIAERIVEVETFDKVWDEYIASALGSREVKPEVAEIVDLADLDISDDLRGYPQMVKPPRVVAAQWSHQPAIPANLALKRLQKLLGQIPEVRQSGHRSSALSTWEGNVKIVLGEFYGENSIPYKTFAGIWFTPGQYYDGQPESDFVNRYNSGLDEAKGFLEGRISDLSETLELDTPRAFPAKSDSRKIFVVHGHDHGRKETVARFLEKLDLEPVILHEHADRGKTVIEKFEAHAADVSCAVVILTGDDVGYSKSTPEEKESRARQNVILELGYFVGKLGRDHTFALVEKAITLPSDIHGVVYIELDGGHWSLLLAKELKAAGLDVDLNRVL